MALLTTTEAAKRCGVCGRTLLRWLASGALPGTQTPGGHWRIDEHDLTRFLASSPDRSPDGLRVLIVEDNAREAAALARVVELLAPGASVEVAGDGLAAGLVLGTMLPHVVFVDIEMPGLDGVEVVRRARLVGALEDTRFAVVSGRLNAERIAALEALGVRDILKKPVRPEAIAEVLRDMSTSQAQKEAS